MENAAFEGVKIAASVLSVKAPYTGAYMVYNLLATAAAADLAGCSPTRWAAPSIASTRKTADCRRSTSPVAACC